MSAEGSPSSSRWAGRISAPRSRTRSASSASTSIGRLQLRRLTRLERKGARLGQQRPRAIVLLDRAPSEAQRRQQEADRLRAGVLDAVRHDDETALRGERRGGVLSDLGRRLDADHTYVERGRRERLVGVVEGDRDAVDAALPGLRLDRIDIVLATGVLGLGQDPRVTAIGGPDGALETIPPDRRRLGARPDPLQHEVVAERLRGAPAVADPLPVDALPIGARRVLAAQCQLALLGALRPDERVPAKAQEAVGQLGLFEGDAVELVAARVECDGRQALEALRELRWRRRGLGRLWIVLAVTGAGG